MVVVVSMAEEDFTVAAVVDDLHVRVNQTKNTSSEIEFMRTRDMNVRRFTSKPLATAVLVLGMLIAVPALPLFAGRSVMKTFSSAEQASNALFQAAQTSDEQQLEAILGLGKEVTSSGDDVEDKLEREQFTQKYQEMHRLVQESDGSMVLYIGAENWPFPLPLVSHNGVWQFDPDAGRQEILFRTIGENEAAASEVCNAFAARTKQNDASSYADDDATEYAKKLLSLRARDAADLAPQNDPPFHGYYFRNAKIAGRVALIVYPAKYQSSGVMTFLVTEGGGVYEKDLGSKTTAIMQGTKLRKVDSSWHPAE